MWTAGSQGGSGNPGLWTGPDLYSRLFVRWGGIKKEKESWFESSPAQLRLSGFLNQAWNVDFDGSLRHGDVIFSSYIGGQWIMKIYPHPILRGLHTHCSQWRLKVTRSGQIIIVQLNCSGLSFNKTWESPPFEYWHSCQRIAAITWRAFSTHWDCNLCWKLLFSA